MNIFSVGIAVFAEQLPAGGGGDHRLHGGALLQYVRILCAPIGRSQSLALFLHERASTGSVDSSICFVFHSELHEYLLITKWMI